MKSRPSQYFVDVSPLAFHSATRAAQRFLVSLSMPGIVPSDDHRRKTGSVHRIRAGGTPPFSLSLFRDQPVLYLGVTVEGDPGELMPRFEIGTAPYAAYAEHAGDASTLGGLSAEDFATAGHTHSFQSLSDLSPGLADGDNDTLAALSCATGETPVKTSVGWSCEKPWTATNDGASSGLDADKLDGMDSTAFQITRSKIYTRNLVVGNVPPGSHAVWTIECADADDVGLSCGCGGYDTQTQSIPHPGARVYASRLEKYANPFDTCVCGLANDASESIAPWITIECLKVDL